MIAAVIFLALLCAIFLGGLARPHWVIGLLFFIVYVQLERLFQTAATVPWLFLKAFGPALALVVLHRWYVRGEPPLQISAIAALLAGYGLLLATSFFYARNTEGVAIEVELYFRYIGLGLIVALAMQSLTEFRFMLLGCMAGAAFLGILGGVSYHTQAFDADLNGLVNWTMDHRLQQYRFEGPIDANELALLLVFVVPIAIERCLHAETAAAKIAAAVTVIACLIGIFLTASRGGLMALIATVLLALALRPRLHHVALISLVVMVVVVALPKEYLARAVSVGSLVGVTEQAPDESLEWRLNAAKIAWNLFRDHSLLGVGVNNYEWYFPQYTQLLAMPDLQRGLAAHNTYAQVAAEQGLVGLTAFLALLGYAGAGLVRAQRSLRSRGRNKDADLVLAFAIGCTGYLVGLLFLSSATRFFWMMLTVALALPQVVGARTWPDWSWFAFSGRARPSGECSRATTARSSGGRRHRSSRRARSLPGKAERPAAAEAVPARAPSAAGAPPDAPDAGPGADSGEGTFASDFAARLREATARAKAGLRVPRRGRNEAADLIGIIAGARCSGVSALARALHPRSHGAAPRLMIASEDADLRRLLATYPRSRLLWIYSHYQRAAALNLSRFGAESCLAELAGLNRQLERGRDPPRPPLQVQTLSNDALGRGADGVDAAALSWHIRTGRILRLGLHRESRVALVNHDAVAVDPAAEMARLRAFLDLPPPEAPAFEAHVEQIRRHAPEPLAATAISADVRALCEDLWASLERSRTQRGADAEGPSHARRPLGVEESTRMRLAR